VLRGKPRAEFTGKLVKLLMPKTSANKDKSIVTIDGSSRELTDSFFSTVRELAIKYGKFPLLSNSNGSTDKEPFLPQAVIYKDRGLQQPLKMIWKFKTDDAVDCSPVVKYETVYIGSNSGTFYALDCMTGEIKWTFELGKWCLPTSTTIVDGVVYINGHRGRSGNTTYAVDAKTGQEKWKFDGAGMYSNSTPAFDDGIIYVGSQRVEGKDAYIGSYGLDAKNGTIVWKFMIKSFVIQGLLADSSHVIGCGLICFGGYDGCLYGVDIRTRTEKWRFDTTIEEGCFPVLAHDTVYIQSKDGNVYGIHIVTGEVTWSFKIKGKFTSPLLVHGDVIYFGAGTKFLYAVNIKKREENWKFNAEKIGGSRPSIADGIIYFVSGDNFLYAVGIDAGNEKWKFKAGRCGGRSSPFISNDVVYFATNEGYIYAVG